MLSQVCSLEKSLLGSLKPLEHMFLSFHFAHTQVVAGGDVSVVTGHQQELANPCLPFAGLTSSSIFPDDLG